MNYMAIITQITISNEKVEKKIEFHNELHGHKNTDYDIKQEMIEH